MKKQTLSGLSGVFVLCLGLMSFKKTNCRAYAYTAVQEETLQSGETMSQAEFAEAYNWYYKACESVGGEIEAPVIIN